METDFDLQKKRSEVIEFLSDRLPEQQVREVRNLLSNYFFNKAEDAFEQLAAEKGWNKETYTAWANDHWRKSGQP